MLIPKVIHRVWCGPHKIPDDHERYWETWKVLSRRYRFELFTWNEDSLIANGLVNKETFNQCQHYSEMSDIARYELLYKFGGIYVDTDFELLDPLKFVNLINRVTNFCSQLEFDRLAVGIIGVMANHPLYKILVNNIKNNYKPTNESYTLGPLYYSAIVSAWQQKFRLNDLTIFERRLFYPYHWEETNKKDELIANLNPVAVHHWAVSYRNPKFKKVNQRNHLDESHMGHTDLED